MSNKNKIIYNDCYKGMDKLDKIYQLAILDPPSNGLLKDEWDNQWNTEDEYIDWLIKIIKKTESLLTDSGVLYLYQWIGEKNPLTMAKLLIEINKQTNLHFKNIITWKKDRGFGVQNNWMYIREELLFFVKDKNNYTFNVQYGNIKRNYIRKCGKSWFKRSGNVWVDIKNTDFPATNIWDDINESSYENLQSQEYSLNRKAKSIVNSQKPIDLSDRIIKASSNVNDNVLIPFAGSGSECWSCFNNERNYTAFENDEVIYKELMNLKFESKNKTTQTLFNF